MMYVTKVFLYVTYNIFDITFLDQMCDKTKLQAVELLSNTSITTFYFNITITHAV